MKKEIIKLPRLEQGDLLYVTLEGSTIHNYRGKPATGVGWLHVNEVSIDGEIINANFCPANQEGQYPGGYGQVIWPKFKAHAFVRGHHGECSPFAALSTIFHRVAAIALT